MILSWDKAVSAPQGETLDSSQAVLRLNSCHEEEDAEGLGGPALSPTDPPFLVECPSVLQGLCISFWLRMVHPDSSWRSSSLGRGSCCRESRGMRKVPAPDQLF